MHNVLDLKQRVSWFYKGLDQASQRARFAFASYNYIFLEL